MHKMYAKTWFVGVCPRPELNRDGRFRKPLLYPFEVQGHTGRRQISAFPTSTPRRKDAKKQGFRKNCLERA